MIEATNIMLLATIILSLWAYFAWARNARGRQLRRLDGRTVLEGRESTLTKQLLILIVFVDSAAACFAVLAWVSPS